MGRFSRHRIVSRPSDLALRPSPHGLPVPWDGGGSTAYRLNRAVNGHRDAQVGGRWVSRVVAIRNPCLWPVVFLGGGQCRGITPLPARASASRCESPVVVTRWAWCIRRSVLAPARVLGMIVPKPEG